MIEFLKKVPWGVLSWVFGILVFYLTLGIWGAQFVFAQVNGQTGAIATIFDSWWQILLFVADIICVLLFAACLAAFIWKKVTYKGGKKVEKTDA